MQFRLAAPPLFQNPSGLLITGQLLHLSHITKMQHIGISCKYALGVTSRVIVNLLAKEMGVGRLPVFERLNRGEMT